jgi:hypothetical protein
MTGATSGSPTWGDAGRTLSSRGRTVAAGRITGNAYKNQAGDGLYYQITNAASLTPDSRRRHEKRRGPRHGVPYATRREALDAMDRRIV